MKSVFRQSKGITVIELAIVLVVIGIVIGIGVSLLAPLTNWGKYRATTDIINAAVESVIASSAIQRRLPTTAEFSNVVKQPQDAWTKALLYIPAPELVSITAPLTDAICGRSITTLTVCQDAACTPSTNIVNAAFVVLSGSENYNIQTSSFTGSPCPAGQTCVRVYPQDTPNIDDYSADFTRQEPYDDIVKWVILSELKTKINCGEVIKIPTGRLPYGIRDSYYNALILAEGGMPYSSGGKYRWCIQTISGSLPSGLSSTPNKLSTDCRALAEASWSAQSDTLTVNGTPANHGTYPLTVFVRDNNDSSGSVDHIASRDFVLTINPQSSAQTAPPPGAQITFADDLSQFEVVENNENAIVVDTTNNTISFGWMVNNTKGCLWFPNAQTLFGKTMRAYYQFQFQSVDTSANSTTYADGYTFTLMQGSNDTTVCQTSGSTESGPFGEYLGYDGLPGKSVAVEFDVYPNAGQNDPAGNYNHVAIDKDGKVQHGNITVGNPVCNGVDTGCVYDNVFGNAYPVTWMEDGTLHNARIEVFTQCDNTCGSCGVSGNSYAYIKVWIDCSACDNLNVNYTAASPKVSHCFVLDSAMDSVKFGFTEATGASVQHVTIYNFGIGFY